MSRCQRSVFLTLVLGHGARRPACSDDGTSAERRAAVSRAEPADQWHQRTSGTSVQWHQRGRAAPAERAAPHEATGTHGEVAARRRSRPRGYLMKGLVRVKAGATLTIETHHHQG